METKNIPTIVMLAAGLVTSIVMYRNQYDLTVTLKTVLIVFFVFYILGIFIKKILDKFCPPPKEEEKEEETEENSEEKEEAQSNEDGSVIEKK